MFSRWLELIERMKKSVLFSPENDHRDSQNFLRWPYFFACYFFFWSIVDLRAATSRPVSSLLVSSRIQAVPTSLSLLQVPFMADEVWIGVLALP